MKDNHKNYMIKRDDKGWHVNLDLLLWYLVALIALVIFAIKAIRCAVTS